MNSIVSLISGQFTRSLIFGAFFPVVLFLALSLISIQPFLPRGVDLLQLIQHLEAPWRLFLITLILVVLTIFLNFLNTPIVRCLEGYPWEKSKFGRVRKQAFQSEYAEMQLLIPRLRLLRDAWTTLDPASPYIGQIQEYLNILGQAINLEYPSKSSMILPTRFGNVLRSFETYSLRQYEMDAIVFWPRIVSVADKETLSLVEDARSSVDFFVNCCVLSGFLALIVFVWGGVATTTSTSWQTVARWLFETATLAFGSVFFYSQSINSVASWGNQVKAVFDIFRWDLLKKMGYQQQAAGRNDERQLWSALTKQVVYGDPPHSDPLGYATPERRTIITFEPKEAEVSIASGITLQKGGVRIYTYQIKNSTRNVVRDMVLTETLSPEEAYVWCSSKMNRQPVEIVGTNPYTFTIGSLAIGATVEVSYSAVAIRKSA